MEKKYFTLDIYIKLILFIKSSTGKAKTKKIKFFQRFNSSEREKRFHLIRPNESS